MLKSEIDDIFASKGKARATTPSEPPTKPQKPKKKKNKRKRDNDEEQIASTLGTDAQEAKRAKRRVPETVMDPSLSVPSSSKSHKTSKVDKPSRLPKKRSKEGKDDDEERFKDSRGTGPRRRTEEGYAIYKEDELGINPQDGGDTPLCPFDCQCCF